MSDGDKTPASTLFNGVPEVIGVLTADIGGNLLEATPRPREEGEQLAASTAAALRELSSIGETLAFGPLELLLIHDARVATVTALKRGVFLLATVEASRGTAQVERALKAWSPPSPRAAPSPPVLRASPTPVPAPAKAAPGGDAAQKAAFSGRLGVFPLPDLLELLRGGRRSGVLVCRSAAGAAALRFRDGLITAARSTSTPDLGLLLVQARKLAPKDLEAPPTRQAAAQGAEALGELLVRAGLVDATSVQRELARQIEHTVRALIGWQDGEFSFDSQQGAAAPTIVPVALDSQAVLLNAFKELDESSRRSGTDS
jgi:predicted regulator of Ras-like GTPase activity (Roadblock/LC7/MglB family)